MKGGPMRQTAIRLPDEIHKRADALIPRLNKLPAYRDRELNRSDVLRIALVRGLEILERETTRKRTG